MDVLRFCCLSFSPFQIKATIAKWVRAVHTVYSDESMKSIMPLDVTSKPERISNGANPCTSPLSSISFSLSNKISFESEERLWCENQGKDKKWKFTFPLVLYRCRSVAAFFFLFSYNRLHATATAHLCMLHPHIGSNTQSNFKHFP